MWGYMMQGGGHWNTGMFWGTHILWWIFILVGIIALVRWISGSHATRHICSSSHDRNMSGGNRQASDNALGILRERYARGEIDKAEFEERKRDLQI